MSYEQNETEGCLYSPCLDLCIRWGRNHLSGKNLDDLQVLGAEWDQLAENGINVARDLSDGFSRLSSRIKDALMLLASDATLDLDQGDAPIISVFVGLNAEDLEECGRAEIYRLLNDAFLSLDTLSYLAIACDLFSKIANMAAFREKIQALLDDVFLVQPLHTLRFIPINVFRKLRLRHIPENEHHLFPWYKNWSDLPPEALDVVTEAAAGWPKTVELSDGTLFMLQRELTDDPELLARIHADVKRMRLAFTALDEAYALRGLLAADEEAYKGSLPEIIGKAGMVGSACRLAVQEILSKTETVAWKFRAGLCGLGLTDEERLNLMKPVENMIRKARRNGRSLTGCSWNIAAFPSDEAMVKSFFNDWIRDLEKIAQQGFMPLPEAWNEALYRKLLFDENPERFALLIAGLDALRALSASLLAVRILNQMRAFSESLAPPSFTLRGERGGSEDKEQQNKPIQLDFPLLPMPEIQERHGKRYHALLLEPETRTWRNVLRESGIFYWGGVGVTGTNDFRLEVREATTPLIRLEPVDYRLFILGVSLDRKVLRAALEESETLTRVIAEGETGIRDIAWIIYVRTEDDPKTE